MPYQPGMIPIIKPHGFLDPFAFPEGGVPRRGVLSGTAHRDQSAPKELA